MRQTNIRSAALCFLFIAMGGSATFLTGATLTLDHTGRLSFDFSNQRVPTWSGNGFVGILSNQTAAPTVLSFDGTGNQLEPILFSIPDSRVVDIRGWGKGADGTILVCGQAYDAKGRGAGFLSLISKEPQGIRTTRVNPYVPYRCALDSDGGIWSVGPELVNGLEHGNDVDSNHGVLRHYDSTGRFTGSFVPRATISSVSAVTWGFVATAKGRVGWYSGPMTGPGSHYVEVSSSGELQNFPDISLASQERVTGLALTDDGSTFVSIVNAQHVCRIVQLDRSSSSWIPAQLPGSFATQKWLALYGGSGDSIVLQQDRFTFSTVKVTAQ